MTGKKRDGETAAPLPPCAILAADDDPAVLGRIRELLGGAGVSITTAADGVEALGHLGRASYDLLLADIEMPKLNGLALAESCREMAPETVVIILTAHARLEYALRALRVGAYDYLLKPFPPEALRATVRRALEKKRLFEQNRSLRQEQEVLTHELDAREVQIQRLYEEMTDQQRLYSIGLLAGGVAHEINNPLSAVYTYVQLLEKKTAGAAGEANPAEIIRDLRRFLPRIDTDIERISRTISQLLEFTRRRDFEPVPDDLNEILREVADLSHYHLTKSDIDVRWHLDQDLPPAFLERGRIASVLINLVTNAIQSMPAGGTLTLTSRVDPENDAYVQAVVEDTGEGIPEELLPYLFAPFSSGRPTGEGAGLGLAYAHEVLRKHRGYIRASNRTGGGAAVSIGVPVAG